MNESDSSTGSLLSRTRQLLRQYELRARKGLGQHFLVNPDVLHKTIQAAGLTSSDLVLEIGPGLGVLTRELVKNSGHVIAVELDQGIAELLRETLADVANFSLVNGNILDLEPNDLISSEREKFPASITDPSQYKLVANLPYYITQPIIRHFCEAALKPQVMVIMVQKEVARNIVAGPGDRRILAIAVQFYGKPEIVDYVPADNFYPVPKVDSAILKITLYPRPLLQVTSEKHFFRIVRAGFSAARKQLVNSLSQGLGIPRAEILSLIQQAGVDPQARPEKLEMEEWERLEKVFAEAGK